MRGKVKAKTAASEGRSTIASVGRRVLFTPALQSVGR